MRSSIVAALMAASALVPAAAMAQRGGGDFNRRDGAREVRGEQREADQRDVRRPERDPSRDDRAPTVGETPRGDRGDRGDFRSARLPREQGPAAGREPGRQDRDEGRRDRPAVAIGGGVEAGNRGRFRSDIGVQATRGSDRPDQWRGRRNDGRGWQSGDRGRGYNAAGGWNRGWRQDDRYDWNRRRQYDRNAYHLPRYYAPSGWNSGYRRFGVGFTLSSVLFRQNYWIGDADYYGLPAAYGPYRWVRYYNDALLVDIYSGQVVDTVYDIFW